MLDIISFLKNTALVIGTQRADDAIDGAKITAQVVDQIQKFTKDAKKTNIIRDGALKHFMREMYSGLFGDPSTLRPDLVEWCASLPKEVVSGGTQTPEKEMRNHGNFPAGGSK